MLYESGRVRKSVIILSVSEIMEGALFYSQRSWIDSFWHSNRAHCFHSRHREGTKRERELDLTATRFRSSNRSAVPQTKVVQDVWHFRTVSSSTEGGVLDKTVEWQRRNPEAGLAWRLLADSVHSKSPVRQKTSVFHYESIGPEDAHTANPIHR